MARLIAPALLLMAVAACSAGSPAVAPSPVSRKTVDVPNTQSRGGLACITGVGFRNIDNHKTEDVHPGWSVEVQLTGRTTYDRHFDWQTPSVIPRGILKLEATRHAADGGRYARWHVIGTGHVRVEVLGRRLSPRRLVQGEASPTGVFELTLSSTPASPTPGCPPLPSIKG